MSKSSACVGLVQRGPLKGQPATGTRVGYARHKRVGETACEACLVAERTRTREYMAKWRKANPDRAIAASRRWFEANPEGSVAKQQRYRATHPERSRESSRRYYAANREKEAARHRRWTASNIETRRAIDRRRRARMRSVLIIPYTADQLAQRLSMFGDRCWMCGDDADSVDHVKPIAVGGPDVLSNLRPACRPCNSRKKDRWPYPLAPAISMRGQLCGHLSLA